VHQHDRIVRPLDTPCLTAAARGVSQKMGDVLNRAGAQWEPRLLANLYAAAALHADDAHGEEYNLITQHYGVLKGDLVIVVDLAAASIVGRHGGSGEHGDCPGCLHSLALGRVRNAIEWTSAPGWDQTSSGSD
jgi:hypothetical protein